MKKNGLAIFNLVCWLLALFYWIVNGVALKRHVADWFQWLSWSLGLVGYAGALFCSIVNILKYRKLKKTVAKLQSK